MNRPGEAEQAVRHAVDLYQGLVDEFPQVPAHWSELGNASAFLAKLLGEQGRLADARREAERAVRNQLAALKLLPGHPKFKKSLGSGYVILAETLVRLGDHGAAAKAAVELPQYSPTEGSWNYHAAAFLARCIPLAEQDPALPPEQRAARARAYGDQAMALLRQGLGRNLDSEQLKADPNLASLRPRADFQNLLRELERSVRSRPEQGAGKASQAGSAARP
jgi:hypothetical protein